MSIMSNQIQSPTLNANASEARNSINNFVSSNAIETGSKADKAKTGLSTDFNHFIKMLTTQMRSQDPTDPMDASKFTEQIVNFTAVEQAVATNSNLEKLIELNKGVQFSHASGLVGKEVVYDASKVEHKLGDNNSFAYSLQPDEGQKISSTIIKIIDSNNRIIRTEYGSDSSGDHQYHWDGLDTRKQKAPSDMYHIKVESFDQDGKKIAVGSPIKSGVVKEAEINAGSVFLNINGIRVPISQVRALKDSTINDQEVNSEFKEAMNNNISEVKKIFSPEIEKHFHVNNE